MPLRHYLPEDVNTELLEALLHELPTQT